MSQATIADLRAQLAAAEAAEKAEHEANAARALQDLHIEYVWEIKWTSAHVFRCSRQLSARTLKDVTAFKEAYPGVRIPQLSLFNEPGQVACMTYLLIDRYLAHTGGGTILLKGFEGSKDPFCQEPRELTQEEVDALRAGIVPDSLKR